jgi:hypothetical protein
VEHPVYMRRALWSEHPHRYWVRHRAELLISEQNGIGDTLTEEKALADHAE